MSNTTSENSSLEKILQEKSVILGICRTHLITYRAILSQLEEFLKGEYTFIHFDLNRTTDITFNCGCCTWSKYLKTYNNVEVKEYFKSTCPENPEVTLGYEINIPNSPFIREEQYIEVVGIDQPPLYTYKFPELPNWMQQYLLKRLEHATALLAIYEAGIKNLEEEIKPEQVKRCSSCHEVCSIEEFTPTRPGRKNFNVCVTCRRKFNAERGRVYRKKNAKAINARLRTKRLFKKFEKRK